MMYHLYLNVFGIYNFHDYSAEVVGCLIGSCTRTGYDL